MRKNNQMGADQTTVQKKTPFNIEGGHYIQEDYAGTLPFPFTFAMTSSAILLGAGA